MDILEKILIEPDTLIQRAIEIIDISSQQIALVVDDDRKLLGTVTDGDIRRGLMRGILLNQPVEQIMNNRPITIPEIKDQNSILNIMRVNKLRHLPVVDAAGRLIGIEKLDDLLQTPKRENWVVIMAGGLGKRLRPLTENCPKPMLEIGGKPILATILEEFIKQGFSRFCLSINYKAQNVIDYFGDGSQWGITLDYIHEDRPMGTAGSLRLFHHETEEPIIIINGDILTKLGFDQLISFHKKRKACATVAVAAYDFKVDYGVVKVDRDMLIGFEEKPVFTSFINAGIYVLNPEILKKLPENSSLDMNQLLEIMLKNNEKVCAFPIREYWIDIGQMRDFNQAVLDYDTVFLK
ncbi:nucleotidyltransferase family protein [Oscillospiraceae bacterium LTW-04]|nr:nucleotidyltransferase family protein [Oscillospiraceae bacterium MB24-C1]